MVKQSFEIRVKDMKASEIVAAMVKGLRRPYTRIDMSTFGNYAPGYNKRLGMLGKRKFCFGCAATNTICAITERKFPRAVIDRRRKRAEFLKTNDDFLFNFEAAIDELRNGSVENYNEYAEDGGFAQISTEIAENIVLPALHAGYKMKDLRPYALLARELRKLEKTCGKSKKDL